MNQQPFEGITQILASVFILYTLYNFYKYSQNPNAEGFSDIYELGYVYEKQHKPKYTNTKTVTKVKFVKPQSIKHKKQEKSQLEVYKEKVVADKPKPKKAKTTYNTLQQDCYDSLIALGMKKKESTYVVNSTFNKHDIKTVQEFLQIALIIPKNEHTRTII